MMQLTCHFLAVALSVGRYRVPTLLPTASVQFRQMCCYAYNTVRRGMVRTYGWDAVYGTVCVVYAHAP